VNSPTRLTDRPAVTAVAGAVTIAFSAILVRLSHASPSTAAVFRCAYALPLLGLLAALERRRFGPPTRRDLRLSAIAGAFFAADLICWHHAIGDVGAGLATVLGNLQVVLVGLLAWIVLGERAERRVLSAIPVVLAGVVLISGAIGHGAYGRDPARGVVFGIFTGLAYAGFILVLRHGNNDLRRPAAPLFEATLAATVFAAIAGVAIGDVARPWLAGAPRAHLPGPRLAPHLDLASAPAGGAHLRTAHDPAGGIGPAGGRHLRRVAIGRPVRGSGGRPGRSHPCEPEAPQEGCCRLDRGSSRLHILGGVDLRTRRARRVLELVRDVPEGFVRTYGDLEPRAPRFAGSVLAATDDVDVPWHRIVRADGSLAKGERQRRLLEAEGVPFRGERVDLRVVRLPR
jgi:drug/metabolite transporter (DMT)-like permease/alkylated DNA nucleotide flippase Atl1